MKLTKMFAKGTLVAVLMSSVIMTGCWKKQNADDQNPKALAVIQAAEGQNVKGELTLTQDANGVKISGKLTGLQPGKHGIQIVAVSEVAAPAEQQAAAPAKEGDKAAPAAKEGDKAAAQTAAAPEAKEAATTVINLGNIEADGEGNAVVDITNAQISLSGESSIVGKAILIKVTDIDAPVAANDKAGQGLITVVGKE